MKTHMSKSWTFKERVFSVVLRIPKGSVLTYGEVARQAGKPRAARADAQPATHPLWPAGASRLRLGRGSAFTQEEECRTAIAGGFPAVPAAAGLQE